MGLLGMGVFGWTCPTFGQGSPRKGCQAALLARIVGARPERRVLDSKL